VTDSFVPLFRDEMITKSKRTFSLGAMASGFFVIWLVFFVLIDGQNAICLY
jgi:hypothetical protein